MLPLSMLAQPDATRATTARMPTIVRRMRASTERDDCLRCLRTASRDGSLKPWRLRPCFDRVGLLVKDEMTGTDLIRRMAEGDRGAFAAFYDRHARQVYPLIVRIVRDP